MERNAAAGRTPSSLPLSTPPPASMNSSPDFAPLSPVHTNSLTEAKSLNVKPEPTNFTLPPSYTEDNRIITSRGPAPDYSLGDQRNDKYIGGGKNVTSFLVVLKVTLCFLFLWDLMVEIFLENSVTSGTLDAIRERMKSMQLAAAAGNHESGSKPLMSVNDNLHPGMLAQMSQTSEHIGVENSAQTGVLPMDEKALSGLQARMERLKSGTIEPL